VAQRYGVNPGDVRRAATTYFSGLLVGNLYQDQTVFDVVVRGSSASISAPSDVGNLLIDTPGGGRVRVGDVAAVRVVSDPTFIAHDATMRSIDVTADVDGRDLGSVLTDVTQRVQALNMPLEVHAEVFSELAQRQNKALQIAGIILAVALAIYLVLHAAFGSWRLAALVFLTLPLAAVGGLVATLFMSAESMLGVLVGLLVLLGIATRNSVLLVRSFQRTESARGHGLGIEGAMIATRESLGLVLLPIGATAAVMISVLPFGGAGTEVLRPLAAVVLAGLFTVTFVNLFVVPVLHGRLASAWSRSATESR
jgi:multidrug efflux pump subunit AcrB